ncbi:helix-turn-helix transcriptional regulator [Microbacterium album]|uniref:HTH cro/C1-type domain-containing protein n=1 Tax=Microbacterium album TaxID=2053191 RepID=A0A917MM95_9MICO|nr:helix-turn-helix transcriptional regulator [Microbacterium album]GGH33937.1 hypothetical protein GCM10010921_01250 [Microbacterium album]
MNRTVEQASDMMGVIRPGLLDRLKDHSGIKSDEAFARTIGVSRETLNRLKKGEEPSLRTVIGIAHAFGLALGEVVTTVPRPDASEATNGARSEAA